MKYVITKNNIDDLDLKPNTKYGVLAIYEIGSNQRIYPRINPTEYKFAIVVITDRFPNRTITTKNTYFKSNRELNLEKILNK